MARIDAFGMPSAELIKSIETLAGTGDREIIVTTDSKDTLEDLVSYSNNSDSSIEINDIDEDKGFEVRIEIGAGRSVTLPHSDKSSVPEDAV